MCNCKSHPCKTCSAEKKCCSKHHPKARRVSCSHDHCRNKKTLKQTCSHNASASHTDSSKITRVSCAKVSSSGSTPHLQYKPPKASENKSKARISRMASSSKGNANGSWFESSKQESLRQRFLVAINRERKAVSLPKLTLNEVLNKCAAKHNYGQAFVMNAISHTGSDGSKLRDRKKRVGYSSIWCGENVAHRQKTPEWCVRSLMKSPGHRKNIMNANAKEMGVHGGIGKDGYWYWTQVLGAGPK